MIKSESQPVLVGAGGGSDMHQKVQSMISLGHKEEARDSTQITGQSSKFVFSHCSESLYKYPGQHSTISQGSLLTMKKDLPSMRQKKL